MDALVFDTHHDCPPRVVPVDRQGQRFCANYAVDRSTHLIAIGFYLRHRRPVVVGVVEVVPAHFINADGEHRLKTRVDAFCDQTHQQQFVDEKSGGVAEVKNQRVAQRDRFFEICLIAGQNLEELFVAIESLVKMRQDAGAAGVGIVTVESKGFNQDGKEVCYFRRRVMVWKKDFAPDRKRPLIGCNWNVVQQNSCIGKNISINIEI